MCCFSFILPPSEKVYYSLSIFDTKEVTGLNVMYLTATFVSASERIPIHLISHVGLFIHICLVAKCFCFFVHCRHQRSHRFEFDVSDLDVCVSVRTHLNPSDLTCMAFHSHCSLPFLAERLLLFVKIQTPRRVAVAV